MNEEEKIKDLKAVYSGAVQSGEIGIANMIKGGIDLLEKKNRTIQQLKDENKTLNRQAQQYFETTIIQSQQYDKETTKKDKIIDLMAEQLTTSIHSKEWVKQYFEDKVRRKENENIVS